MWCAGDKMFDADSQPVLCLSEVLCYHESVRSFYAIDLSQTSMCDVTIVQPQKLTHMKHRFNQNKLRQGTCLSCVFTTRGSLIAHTERVRIKKLSTHWCGELGSSFGRRKVRQGPSYSLTVFVDVSRDNPSCLKPHRLLSLTMSQI